MPRIASPIAAADAPPRRLRPEALSMPMVLAFLAPRHPRAGRETVLGARALPQPGE